MTKVKVTQTDMAGICAPCVEKMKADGVAYFFLDTDKEDLGLPMEVSSGVSDRLGAFALDESRNIKGVEIFAAGTWNGDSYTEKDLDEIVSAFHDTKDALQPYLKLGHSSKQTLLAGDELPAAGWVTNLYRVGSKLVADFADIPRKIADLIRAKAYKRVSSEIFVNIKVAGKKYPYALKAVALLGGETPAVQTLDDIHALYALDSSVLAYSKEAEARVYEMAPAQLPKEATMPEDVKPAPAPAPAAAPEIVKEHAFPPGGPGAPGAMPHPSALPAGAPPAGAPAAGGDDCYKQLMACQMELQQHRAKMGAMQPRFTEMESAIASYKLQVEGLTKDLETERGELNKFKLEAMKKDIKSQVAKFVQDKKVLPSQAGLLEELLTAAKSSAERKFKVGEKEFSSEAALIEGFVALGGGGLTTSPESEPGKAAAVNRNDGDSVHDAVEAYMKKTGEKSYKLAYIAVKKELDAQGVSAPDKA